MIFSNRVLLFAGVGAAAALQLPRDLNPLGNSGLSNACQEAILGVSGNAAASTCLNVPGLAAILTLQADASAIPALNTWLEGLCRADPCTTDTINAITTNITTGCQSDIANTGVAQSTLQAIMQEIPVFYPTIRDIACLKTASNDTFCTTSALLDVQAFVGTSLSAESAMATLPKLAGQGSLPASLVCTGCNQAAWDVFKADDALLAADPNVQSAISQQCGADFLTAPQPTDVVEGTGAAAPTGAVEASLAKSPNSATSVALTSGSFLGLAASSMLLVVMSAWA